MITVNISESFPITVALLDESTGALAVGETVYYDIRTVNDAPLSPPISGTLTESTIEAGIYKESLSIPTSGNYICYASAEDTDFAASTEEIIVNTENIYDLTKNNYHYNLNIEDVVRTNSPPTASQTARNVPRNKTDYVITRVKSDDASDWSSPIASGIVYAHYRDSDDDVPYKMGGPS